MVLEEHLSNDVHTHLKSYRKRSPGMHLVPYWEVGTGYAVLGEAVDDTAGVWEGLAMVQHKTFRSLDEGYMMWAKARCVANREEEVGSALQQGP